MSLREVLQARQQSALKAGETATLSTLRLLWAAVKNEEISLGHPLTDQEVQTVAARQVKQLNDARPEYAAGGRADLVAQADAEIRLLSEYLPTQLGETELRGIARRIITELDARQPGDVGRVMGRMMKEVRGQADGSRVREIVSALLAR